ncbi:GGDEF domain-containing protein [Bacillaceae bacterium S4-13-58]
MKEFFNRKNQLFIYFSILQVIILGLTIFSVSQPSSIRTIIVSFLISLFTIGIGIWKGPTHSLAFSLLSIFLIGSYWFWTTWRGHSVIEMEFSNQLVWLVSYLITAILAGLIHQTTVSLHKENVEMKAKYNELVSIDPNTGFNNRKRFFFELEQEFKRSERYGSHLSLLCFQIDYLEQFKTLYGLKEFDFLMMSIAKKVQNQVRASDSLFRIEDRIIGVLLKETSEDNIQYVIDKLEQALTEHTLSNHQKQINLTLSFGHSSYKKDMGDYKEMYSIVEEQLNNNL